MGAGACYGEVKGHFPLLISYVSEVDIEEEAVKGKKQNSACYNFLPFHTVHGFFKARILKWFAIPFSSGPHSVRTLHHDLNFPLNSCAIIEQQRGKRMTFSVT